MGGRAEIPQWTPRLLSLVWGRVPIHVGTPTCWVTQGVSLGSASFSNMRELDSMAPKCLLVLKREKGCFSADDRSLQHLNQGGTW